MVVVALYWGVVLHGLLGGVRGASKSSRGRGCGKILLITASPKPLKTLGLLLVDWLVVTLPLFVELPLVVLA